MWIVFFVRHVLHLTSQHQWKVHAQRSTTVTSCVRYPRPQHIRSHPSTPIDVSLHWRPCVPKIPNRRFFSQNPGDCSKYTRSLGVGGLWSGLYGFSENLYLLEKESYYSSSIEKASHFSYLFCFLWFCPTLWTEFVSLTLFEFCAMFLFLLLLRVIWFSLLFLRLLLTCTRDAPSNRSFSESPMTRKLGKRIQHVLTEQDPDIPWHLHSSRISCWTCCKSKKDEN